MPAAQEWLQGQLEQGEEGAVAVAKQMVTDRANHHNMRDASSAQKAFRVLELLLDAGFSWRTDGQRG